MLCEKICIMHRNPINCFLHLVAGILLIYALWVHDINLIIWAVLIFAIGHLIQTLMKRKQKKEKRK